MLVHEPKKLTLEMKLKLCLQTNIITESSKRITILYVTSLSHRDKPLLELLLVVII